MAADIMLDLETLGTRPGSVIAQIGAVEFDPGRGRLGRHFFVRIDPSDAVDEGLKIYPGAVLWWLRQSDEARREMTLPGVPLRQALGSFSEWVARIGPPGEIRMWGNAATFDNVLLQAAYTLIGQPPPWEYRGDRCFRTMREMFRNDVARRADITREECIAMGLSAEAIGDGQAVNHSGLWDAITQAVHLISISQHLSGTASPAPPLSAGAVKSRAASAVPLATPRPDQDPQAGAIQRPKGNCHIARQYWKTIDNMRTAADDLKRTFQDHEADYARFYDVMGGGMGEAAVREFFPDAAAGHDVIMGKQSALIAARNSFMGAFDVAMAKKTVEIASNPRFLRIPLHEAFHEVFTALETWRAQELDGRFVPLQHLLAERGQNAACSRSQRGFESWFAAFAQCVAPGRPARDVRNAVLARIQAGDTPGRRPSPADASPSP